jgi:hypothetical protein
MKPLVLAAVAVVMTIGSPIEALAQAEVKMRNGSILYGEVKKLEFAKLTLDTDDFGLIDIDWDPVAFVKAPGPFAVTLESGQIFTGAIEVDTVDVTIVGATSVTVPRSDIASFKDFDKGFWNRASAGVDIGANVSRGNNRVTSVNAGINLGYASDVTEIVLRGTALVNEQQDANDTRRYTASLSGDREVVGRLRAGVSVGYERDENQQLDYRSQLGFNGAFRAISHQRTRLDLVFGGGPTLEKFTGAEGTSLGEGKLGFSFIGRPNGDTDIDLSAFIYPELFDADRIRIESDLIFRVEIIDDLTINFSTYYRFNNQPPADVEESDYGFTVGVGWSY